MGLKTTAIVAEVDKLFDQIERNEFDYEKARAEAEDRYNELRKTNAQRIHDLLMSNVKTEAESKYNEELKYQKQVESLIKKGFNNQQILKVQGAVKSAALLKQEDQEYKKSLKNKSAEEKKQLKKDNAQKKKDHKALLKEMSKEERAAYEQIIQENNAAEYKAAKEAAGAKAALMKGSFEKSKLFGSSLKTYDQAREAGASGGQATAIAAIAQLKDWAKALESTMKNVAYSQSEIDTRLQGSKRSKNFMGSYWQGMSETITQNVGVSPFVKQEKVVENLKTLVGQGISFNVEQRAFLDTISDKIATTFDATDASLLKLVRIQQADSTAARLGMESALTSFLNNMYETTEYMQQAADEIRGQIYEASALMDAEAAAEFEYEIQKWMGSLYSVGFNNSSGLAGALGKLAAGDISGITDGGYGNLLVMAANKANLSIAEILADGLNSDNTNELMQAMVDYLGGIYEETKDNKVVAQQFANVYGLTASDLKAAANLAGSTQNIYKNSQSYSSMLTQLNTMADSMWQRTSTGEMMDNLMENFKYSMAASMGNNPVLYSIYTMGSMLEDLTGGISIPAISVMGSGFDLETTVADLMQVGAMSGGILSGMGQLIAGLAKGSGGGFSGSGMLKAFGVNTTGTTSVTRGNGVQSYITTSGQDSSFSGYIGNEDGGAVQDKTISDAEDSASKQLAQAIEDSTETTMATVDEHVVQIVTLLQDVVSGASKLHITYGGGDSAWTSYSPSGGIGL